MKMIFVNLPVKDLPATRAFFDALGFGFNPDFSDDNSACMIVSDTIYVMLLTERRFADFVTGEISDPEKGTQVITCLSANSRQEVDAMLEKALAAGGRAWQPTMEMGPMYGCSFQDVNGHVWEFMHMDQGAAA